MKRIDKYIEELQKRYIKKPGEKRRPSKKQIERRIRETQKEFGISAKKATEKLKWSLSFSSTADQFRHVVMLNLNHNVGLKNKLRYFLSQEDGTPYKQTQLDLNKFSYDKVVKGLVYSDIVISINNAGDSLSSDLLSIYYNGEDFTMEVE